MSEPSEPNTMTPWKVSLAAACIGAFFVSLLFAFPSLRWFPLAEGSPIPTPFVVALVPVVALVWAIVGLRRREKDKHLVWCVVSLGLSVASITLAMIAYWFEVVAATTGPT